MLSFKLVKIMVNKSVHEAYSDLEVYGLSIGPILSLEQRVKNFKLDGLTQGKGKTHACRT